MGLMYSLSSHAVDDILAMDDYDTMYVENGWSFQRVPSRTKHRRYAICYGRRCAEIAVTDTHTRYNFVRQLKERMRRLRR